jgi:ATP-dependent DNA helicase RecG
MNTEVLPPPQDIRYLKGVGPKRALALERLGITSVRELLYFFPRRYEDRSQFRTIDSLLPNEAVTIRAEILTVRLKPLRHLSILEVAVGDKTGMIPAVWFNQPYLKKQFDVGQQVILFGKIELYQNRLQMTSPEYEVVETEEETVHTGRITPIYPLTEGLFQRSLRATLKEILETHLDKTISDPLPEFFRMEKKLVELREAIREMHFPSSFERQILARRRVVFDEFFIFEMILLQKMERMKAKYRAYSFSQGEHWAKQFTQSLPFSLTRSQVKALEEIGGDLEKPVPMNRLLQGDVGSGKTLVAAFALLLAAKNGCQAALLAPTEILAEQHFRTLENILNPFSVSVGRLTSSTPSLRRERLLAELKQGKLPILIGTHAMLQEDVRFKSLGVVVIDEQHKFGVYQRCQLLNADPRPHQLVMTATPIPRTLALTIYGDLETSTMKELPAGRQPIKTYWITRKRQREILEHILKKAQSGEQAYFIFPLIEETEKSDLLAAKKEFENLKTTVFRDLKMGLVHGRMTKEERDAIMQAFRNGEIQILVATSVVEVGVDHPNATVMVIENAERFGLSQLHQMRGRIGRGTGSSECFLFGEPKTDEGKKRLRILTKSQDGFLIAQEDLKLRGPGDFLGTRQSGEPFFRIAHPVLDEDVLLEARETAIELLKHRVLEQSPEWQGMKSYLEQVQLRY